MAGYKYSIHEFLERIRNTVFHPERGYVELRKEFPEQKFLWNPDFHPTPLNLRTWGAFIYFAIWFGMAFEVESWALVSIGYSFGLNWFWSILAVFLGNAIVLIPMIIISHAGARFGLPETVITRSRWGVYGSWLPVLIRGIIGAGWWGIDTWIIAESFSAMYLVSTGQTGPILEQVEKGIASPVTIATVIPALFWTILVVTIVARLAILYVSPPKTGQRTLKLMGITVPFISLLGFIILFAYVMPEAHWQWSSILQYPTQVSGSAFWFAFIGLLNANIAFWATMALSMPDYTRFAKSQYSQVFGQLSLPFIMIAIGALGLVVTGASIFIYKTPIWDPILLASLAIPNPIIADTAIFLMMLGVLVVNIYADTVGPAYDFANIYPGKLSWFAGAVIVTLIAAALQSWSYYFNAVSYVENWLITYGVVLGAVEGVIIFDYAVIRRFRLSLYDNYIPQGRFRYWKGINPAAFISFAITMILVFPPNYYGIPITQLYPGQAWVYQNGWISSIVIAGIIYLILMRFWVMPRYQPEVIGDFKNGFNAPDEAYIFGVKDHPAYKIALEYIQQAQQQITGG